MKMIFEIFLKIILYALSIGIPFGILFYSIHRILVSLKINKFVCGDYRPSEEGTIFRIKTDIKNNGFCDIRIDNFAIRIKHIIHFLNISDVKEDGDITIFLTKGRYEDSKYSYYVLKNPYKANLKIEFDINEEVRDDLIKTILIIKVAPLPFPFSKIPFLSERTQKFHLEKYKEIKIFDE